MKFAAATTIASACLTALAGCSGTTNILKPQPAAAVATSGTYYCWQEKLADDGSNLTCNWQHSMADACDSTSFTSLPKGNLTGMPQKTHRCENGQWLVAVNAR